MPKRSTVASHSALSAIDEVAAFAADLARLAGARGLAVVVLAADADHARPFAPRVLVLNGSTGELAEPKKAGLLSRLMGT